MSEESEKTCPLCAEEMDLTDQQLKPCKCGYEICVWCWHQIMDLAEKDESEGRCPACRTSYDKDKIVGVAANCERLVAEFNMEKKHKSQKAKARTSESRKQLTSVRVIKKNLVYIVGLPLDLADEDLLQRKEYFSQYGKVLKVSISRTSAGTIQQFANNTCSVYITYSNEEEAVRCIQSVHGFILDERPLRACFGTTKYCHAWLRNALCNNPDCLYLHEIGSQEDSFTKDEFVSAHTRVQQITGVANNLQRRSGSVLPSPADDYSNTISAAIAKPIVKSSSNNSTSCTKGSPPNKSSVRSGALPPTASWGARVSNFNPPTGSVASSNGPTKQKAETNFHGIPVLATNVCSSVPINSSNVGEKQIQNEETYVKKTKKKLETLDTTKQHPGINSMVSVSEVSCTVSGEPSGKSTSQASCSLASASDVEGSERLRNTHSEVVRHNGWSLNTILPSTSEGLQWHDSEKRQEQVSCGAATSKATDVVDCLTALKETSDLGSDAQSTVTHLTSETEDDFNNQRLQDAIAVNRAAITTSSLHHLSHLRVSAPIVNRIADEGLATNVSSASNGFLDHFVNRTLDLAQDRSLLLKGGQGNHVGTFNGELSSFDSRPSLDMGENNIISNILSLDIDSWDDSLTSPQVLAKFLGESDKQEGPSKLAGSWKGQISNQSRFSFARQEDSRNHLLDNRDSYLERNDNGFGSLHRNVESSDNFISGHSIFASSKLPLSRSQISAPPGFSTPSMPPPPGFSLHESGDQPFDILKSGNHMAETSSFLRNSYQELQNGNLSGTKEIEFFDPAIMAVGEGKFLSRLHNSSLDMRPNFPVQTPSLENNTRLQELMQRSLSPHQNLRYTEVRDSFSPSNDAYGFTSQLMDQSQVINHASFMKFSLQQPRNVVSNGLWDGWNELQAANNVGMGSDRLGINKLYGGYEDAKFRMINSGDLYNRSFGM